MRNETLPSTPPFHTQYGFSRPETPGVDLTVTPYPEICHRGSLRPAILASAVDIVASLYVREVAGTDATFTSDLSIRAPRRKVPQSIELRGEVLRSGKGLVTTAVFLESEGHSFAYGEATFTRFSRPAGDPPNVDTLSVPKAIYSHPLRQPLLEEVGARVSVSSDPSVQLALEPRHRNPEGILQGALVALLVECAALARADTTPRAGLDAPAVVNEMDIRYLAAAREGPIVGTSEWIGDPADRMLRVELRDQGLRGNIGEASRGRRTMTAFVRVADSKDPDAL